MFAGLHFCVKKLLSRPIIVVRSVSSSEHLIRVVAVCTKSTDHNINKQNITGKRTETDQSGMMCRPVFEFTACACNTVGFTVDQPRLLLIGLLNVSGKDWNSQFMLSYKTSCD